VETRRGRGSNLPIHTAPQTVGGCMGSSNGVPAGKRLFPACILTQLQAQCMRVVGLDSCSTRLRYCGRVHPKKCVSYCICFIPSDTWCPPVVLAIRQRGCVNHSLKWSCALFASNQHCVGNAGIDAYMHVRSKLLNAALPCGEPNISGKLFLTVARPSTLADQPRPCRV